ncbi:MAG: efflux RND transporter permease subunit [Candidatus Binataceae bacterium]
MADGEGVEPSDERDAAKRFKDPPYYDHDTLSRGAGTGQGTTERAGMNRIPLRRFRWVAAVVVTMVALFPGCKRATAKQQPPPPTVTVSRPLQREVTRWDEYSGCLSSPGTVIVNARVSGLIKEAPFQEGTIVHAGDLLFKIDPRPFQADLDNKQAAEAAMEAARLRLRPTLMTSFAFIFGVIPLIMATGAGAKMRQALGTVVFFGMIGVTVFPTSVFYTVIRRATDRRVVATERPAGSVRTPAGGGEDRPAVGGTRR